uniref:Fibroblast growth factor n=1 Tax=Sarcophilus harrisii TaxID=9305 RepID=A0A7N4PLS9_SARHA
FQRDKGTSSSQELNNLLCFLINQRPSGNNLINQSGRDESHWILGPSVYLFKLQLQAEERGVVSIKGVCANRYLAMKEDGRLLALKCVTEECFFFERLESNNYNTYRSRKYSNWYVALKRTGQYKLGSKTGPGQKAILFLPMSAKS